MTLARVSPAPPIAIGFKTSPQNVDWATVDATWRRAGELSGEPGGGFDSGWLNDHITDMSPDDPGSSLEAMTLLADARPPRSRR